METKYQRGYRVLEGVNHRIRTGHGNLYVSINRHPITGAIHEVLLNLGKNGTCEAANIQAMGKLATLLFRAGVGAPAIIEQLRNIECSHPRWEDGVQVTSVADGLAKVLELEQGDE